MRISTESDKAEIRYTLNGLVPTNTSKLYSNSEPILLNNTTELRAQVFSEGESVGTGGTAIYVARAIDINLDLPIIVLDNYGAGSLSSKYREFIPVAFMLFGLREGLASLSSEPELVTRADFHIRGQSTASFAKEPYRIEFWDNDDQDMDWPLLGMPAESDWALRGPYADKALIRDAFIYDLGREMGMPAPHYAFFELYVNVESRPLSSEDYMGVYLIVETIKNAKNRLDLKQLKEEDVSLPDITGGYIFKFEWLVQDADEPTLECSGSTSCWNFLKIHDPIPLVSEQEAWITTHLQSFNDVLHSQDFSDDTIGYSAYIDVDSFVDQLIINELSREMDSYIRSAYFYKNRDTKIFAGPLWDYNLIFGVGGFFENDRTSGWQYEQERQPIANDWFPVLLSDPAFVEQVAARWKGLRSDQLSNEAIEQRINTLTALLINGAQRNFERWPNLSQAQIVMFRTPTADTWEGQVQFMHNWLLERIAWLDTQWQ